MKRTPATAASSLMSCTNNEGKITDLAAYKRYERNLTIAKTLEATNIITLSNQLGEKAVIQRLYTIIDEGIGHFKVSNPMTAKDILSASIDILSAFSTDTLEDVIIALKNARMGLYGEIYNRVDGPLIIGWLRKHLNDKYRAKEEALKNIQAERNTFTGVEDAQALAMLSKIREGLEAKASARRPENRQNTTLESFITGIEARAESLTIEELKEIKEQLTQST